MNQLRLTNHQSNRGFDMSGSRMSIYERWVRCVDWLYGAEGGEHTA